MSRKKGYTGYKSFEYLEKGVDFRYFKLAKEIGWGNVVPYEVPLSKAEEEKLEEILEKYIIISLHDHVFVLPEDINEVFEYFREGRCYTAYEALSLSYLDAVFENFLDGLALITSKSGWKWTDIIYDIGMRFSDIAHQDFLIKCDGVKDIMEAKKDGKIALVPSLEAATCIENELDRIDVLYGLGIRCMGITYSEGNALGFGIKEKRDGGLTDFGYKVVERMNKIGMAIDIAHCGDQTSLDVIEASKTPVFISHAGARALWNTKRMKPDEVLHALAEKGGVIGIEAAPDTTMTQKHPKMCIESVMEHFEYCVNLIGVDHVAIGPDTMYGDHVALHRICSKELSMNAYKVLEGKQPEEYEYVRGMENPTEATNNFIRWLIKHGYSDQEIEKVVGGNILRVLNNVWRH